MLGEMPREPASSGAVADQEAEIDMATIPDGQGLIYGLHLLDDPTIRYVGLTAIGLRARLQGHYRDASRGGSRPVCRWLRKHRGDVAMEQLGQYPLEELAQREIEWIARLRNEGLILLNVGIGGNRNWLGTKRPDQSVAMTGAGNPVYGRSSILDPALERAVKTRTFPKGSREGTYRAGNRRLTEEAVIEMHLRRRSGLTLREVGEPYGLSKESVANILKGKSWGWVEIPATL